MAIQSSIHKQTLQFKIPAGTSRGILTEKDSWFIRIWEEGNPEVYGVGECSPLKGLSIDDVENYDDLLKNYQLSITNPLSSKDQEEVFSWVESACPPEYPSIRFGLESALLDLINGGNRVIFPGEFASGKMSIPINGLVWMGDKDFMMDQLKGKLESGFNTIKIKVGAIDFEQELELLKFIRSRYSAREITIRVDANGAFSPVEAQGKLEKLAEYDIHSIEQPIKQGQTEFMYELCRRTPIPIALDEELIGVNEPSEKERLLDEIEPQYIILKPTLHGGLSGTLEWIELAKNREIGWWITSALESNVGLNAIAQLCGSLDPRMPQGLGTGQLFVNNIDSPLSIEKGYLSYDQGGSWNLQW